MYTGVRAQQLLVVMFAIFAPSSSRSQEWVRVVRPIGELDPHDPIRFPLFDPVRPHFEWSMKKRFGYDYSLCYLNPESGAPFPAYPWVVGFNATGTSGKNPPFSFDW